MAISETWLLLVGHNFQSVGGRFLVNEGDGHGDEAGSPLPRPCRSR